ncbi:DNRLRE domain-containing protein, partial [Streptomyces sp. NPDC048659]|uniref:DNRLRE domain-containing protein n=1 Tax=Streptomyces sp. NPDC048659 TaxID=3155489 RepID=UPI00342BB612
MTAGLAEGGAAFAAEREPAATAVTEAADLASARTAAKLSGKKVEALSERSETSTTWANPDGSLTSELFGGPVRFERDGAWTDVDVRLRKAPDGDIEPVAHPHGLELSAGGGGAKPRSLSAAQQAPAHDLVTLGEGDQQITLQWKGGLPAPQLNGTRARYPEAVPGADVIVDATRTGFEQFVEIKRRPDTDAYTYTLPLRTQGLDVQEQPDGSLLFVDGEKKRQAVMPAPLMWDASTDPVSGEHTRRAPVAMKVVRTDDGVDLVLTPDPAFLADPATTYPVTVDPSTGSLGNVFDTYVQQGETRDWSTDTELDLGNPGTKNANGTPRTARSFITWNTAPIADSLISSATLSLWNFHSANTDCKAYPWEVWATGKASTASRWTAQPAWTAKRATSTQTTGNPGCSTQPDGWITADVKTLVQEWASSKEATSGMGLRATSETEVAQWKRVNSANAAQNPPKLSVTYNYRPGIGTKQEAGPPYFSYGGAYMVNTVRPVLRDTITDKNGDKVNATFQIFDSVTDQQVGGLLVSPYVASGQPAAVTVPAGVLTDGRTYKFRSNSYDGTHYNTAWSAWKTFTVDTRAPSAPVSITSKDYPADRWAGGAGKPGTFAVTPASADVNWLEWSLDGTTWTKVSHTSAATANLSVTPATDGTLTLRVRAVDKADNRSEAAEYAFDAGPGGVAQPGEGTRIVRRVPLVAHADGRVFDQVSFSWRRSEADPWQPIPAAHVSGAEPGGVTWPVPLTGGKNKQLSWEATRTVDPDGTIQLKADLTGPGGAKGATAPRTVVVDRNASGAATTDVGPGSVNLLTGDYALSASDVSAFDLSVNRSASSRRPDAGTKQTGQAPIFGKEWVAGTAAETTDSDYAYLNRLSDTAVDVVDAEGDPIHFTANAARDGWVAEPGAEDLVLRGSVTGTFTLSDPEGTVTTFTRADATAPTWQVSSTLLNGLAASATTVVSETVTVDGVKLARPKRVVAPSSATTAAACTSTPSTRGCRALEYVYATGTTAAGDTLGDVKDQVKEIRLWSTEPGAAAATAKTVQTYRYDARGRLRETWNPLVSPALKTAYDYDDAGRVTGLTPPGEQPWTFAYGSGGQDATAGDGKLLRASRPALAPGSADRVDGTAATSVVYGVPLTGDRAPYPMGARDVAAWGQLSAPTDATAVLPADAVPSAHAGGELAKAAYHRATVRYLDVSGREVNTAEPGGHISAADHDENGNAVRELSAANRALALGADAADRELLADLGIAGLPGPERAELLATRSVYDRAGTRELEELGPLHRVDLTADLKSGGTVHTAAGESVTARSWTVKEYDAGRPTDGSASIRDQVTRSTSGAQVRAHPEVLADPRVTETAYDWTKGLPTRSVQDPGGLALATGTEYDEQGRKTKEVPPGSSGSDAAARVTSYWSAAGSGACAGRPEWADQLCSVGPAGTVGGGHPAELPTTTTEYNWWGQPAKVTETANGVTRTTTTTFDAAGRPVTSKVTGGVGQAVPESTTVYDPASGREVKTVSPTGGTITKAYDTLGRLVSYTDADGGATTTSYDRLGRPVEVRDSVPSTVTYAYDTSVEPRGLATSTTDSVAGTFSARYDADGGVTSERLPGGYTLTQKEDPTGTASSRVYTRDRDGLELVSDTVSESIHGQVTQHSGWSQQSYGYDATGRLTRVEDTVESVCTTRAYGFDKRTHRTSLTSAAAAKGADCTAAGGTTTRTGYDGASRITEPGYVYDAFGRTTSVPGHGTVGYYANDLAYQQTADGKRQTWQLDAAHRFRSFTVDRDAAGTWLREKSKRNHYDSDGDNPRWIVEDTASGALTRNVDSASGDLAATTGKSGDTVLQLTNIHGDVALQLPLDGSVAPVALDTDEYGVPRAGQEQQPRYGWLGGKQRSGETLTGLSLMGVRLYDPSTGRFLSTDPVYGGNANPYDYVNADPVNMFDLDGKWGMPKWAKKAGGFVKRNIGTIATVASVASMFVPGLGMVALGLNAYSAYRSIRSRDYVGAAMTLPGIGIAGKSLRMASKAKKAKRAYGAAKKARVRTTSSTKRAVAKAGNRYRSAAGKATRWGRYDARYTAFGTYYAAGQTLWNNRALAVGQHGRALRRLLPAPAPAADRVDPLRPD